jgi:cation diffusion facilitator family transporter
MKLAAGYASGSVGVLSEGMHSFLDVISAGIAFFTVREAGKPADHDHPFGHGKIETLSSLFESILLLFAAALITYEGVERFLHPEPLRYEGLAFATIAFSAAVSYYMYRHNRGAAVAAESGALHVNALHFLSDVVASVGVLAGLALMKVTGWLVIDPLIAFAVALYILVISARQVRRALQELADTQLPEEEIAAIRDLIEEFRADGRMIEAHDLRTRKSGATRHIDFHLVVCGQKTVEESHAICDQIEDRILGTYPRASINIHVEPCENERTGCQRSCPVFLGRAVGGPLGERARG